MKKLIVVLILNALLNAQVSSQLCTGTLGPPIVNINLGSGAVNPAGTLPTIVGGAGTTYAFRNAIGTPPAVVFDGEYSIVNQVPNNGAWHTGSLDHTPNDNNGYMLFFNAAPNPGVFYTQTIPGLCVGTQYEFSAWIANVINSNVLPTATTPNVSFIIRNPTTMAIIAQVNTGNLAANNTLNWVQSGMTFAAPATSIILELSNANVGGVNNPGNDLVIDDISFRPCIIDENKTICIQSGLELISLDGITWTTENQNNLVTDNGNIYFDPSISGEGEFTLVSPCRTIRLTVVNCCEDPCSWSKTGNDNINSGHFLGTRNNADLNFRTNNSLNMKLGVSGHLTLNEGKSLMFGKITSNSSDNRWGIEEFDGGLNFWKPWPTPNSGNYNMFLSNDGKVGIQIGNTPLWGKALGWNWHKFQVRGWGLSDGWATFSDERLKKNFRNIEKPTQTLMAIKAYQYDYNTEQFDNQTVKSDKVENKQKMAETNGLTKRYGFKAQEVEKILPDLVHNPTNSEGFKSMDYDGFIPILIEAFKELNAKVEKQNNAVVENEELKAKIAVMEDKFALLEKTITQLCESGCEGLKKAGSSSDVDVLYQSIPNPTDSEALINYHLSREYRDASISVSSHDGKKLMTLKLDAKKGAGSIKINLGDLANGTYLYTLVAGERVIDTKKLQIIK